MDDKIAKIKRDITKLEEEVEKNHFGSLFDKNREAKNHKKLKKLRKELKELEK